MAFLDKTGLSYALTKIKAWVESRGYLTEHQSLNGWLPKPVNMLNTDVDTLTEQGVYYIAGSETNLPVGSNGVITVFCPSTGSYIHQWYRRYGTAGTNDHHIYVRARASGSSTWGEWTKILTSKDIDVNVASKTYVDNAIAAITDADSKSY